MSYKTSSLVESQVPRKVILIVEDDVSIGEFLVEVLEEETSYSIVLVSDAFQALKRVQDIKPHLFVLDYLLPGMDGIALYDQLHAEEAFQQTPALFMSANAPTKELEQRHVSYLQKPFELEEMLQAVQELLHE